MENWLIWLIVAALLIIVELFTSLVATFCLAVGCLFSMVVSLLDMGLEAQLMSLIVGTIIAFVAFAPIVRRWQKRHEGCDSTGLSNMDALKGRVVEVIEAIPEHGTGRVRVDGDRWQARCVDDSEVAVGTRVRIVGYDSIILEVEKL